MKLKIISTDLSIGETKVVNADTGEMLEGVQRISIEVDAYDGVSYVVLKMKSVELDIDVPENFVEIIS